jgi:hypothetical protein
LRSLVPALFIAVAAAASFVVWRRRERLERESRTISGGRKALVLNLMDRN